MVRKKNDVICLILTCYWNSVHEEGSCSYWLASFFAVSPPKDPQGPTLQVVNQPWISTQIPKTAGFTDPLKDNSFFTNSCWKSLSPEWGFCSGNAGQHPTPLSGIKSHPWSWTPQQDHGPWRSHTRAEKTSKKEAGTEEWRAKSSREPKLLLHCCLTKGTYKGNEGEDVRVKFRLGKGEERCFPYFMFAVFVSLYPIQ